jgi:hypothetical protein
VPPKKFSIMVDIGASLSKRRPRQRAKIARPDMLSDGSRSLK